MQKLRNYFERAAPWAQASLFLLFFLILLVVSGTLSFMFPGNFGSLFFGIIGCIGGIANLILFDKLFPASWEIAGVSWHRKTIQKFLAGVLIGLFVFLPILIILVGFSPLEIEFTSEILDSKSLLHFLPILPLALMEEIGFRSLPQQLIARNYGIWVSQFTIAIAFGVFHIFYGWSPMSAFMGPFVWAFLFGLSAIISKGIAVPTGIHFSLNILQSLAGMKGKEHYTIIKLDYPPGTPQGAMAETEQLGIWLQIALFAIFIVITYLYTRYIRAESNPLHLAED